MDSARVLAIVSPAPDLSAAWAALPPLDVDGYEFLQGRGLEAAADWCRAAPDAGPLAAVAPGIAVAMRDASGCVVAIQARNLRTGKGHDFRVHGASKAGMFGDPGAVANSANVVICEGLTDTLAAIVGMAKAKSTAIVGIAGVQVADALRGLPWKGKRAFVAMDADDSGDAAAKVIAELVEAGGGSAIRLRPEGGKDLAEMLSAGVDLYEFARSAPSRSAGFRLSSDRTLTERATRIADRPHHVGLGIDYLASLYRALIRSDVLLLGAETGAGKTEAATLLAMDAAMAGKRVHYFALEAEEGEIERRIKYKLLCSLVYRAGHYARGRLNFVDWRLGLIDDITGPFEDAADQMLAAHFPKLHTFYRASEFSSADLRRACASLRDESDLAVVDHFHYIEPIDADVNRGAKRIMQSIEQVNRDTGIPLVLVAHLKKPEALRNAPLVPRLSDFHGSSDIGKIVTKAAIFAPAYDQKQVEPHLHPTYVRAGKFRLDSGRTRYVGLCNFNSRTSNYEAGFVLGRLTDNDRKFEIVAPDKIPAWARQGDDA